MLRDEGVFYPIHGVLDFSDESYKFPLTRTKDPLNIMQQCHSMLRSKASTHEVHASENGETFQLIKDMLDSSSDWKPLLKSNSSMPSRRQLVYQLLKSTHNENAMEAMYDERFVSAESLFCRGSGLNSETKTSSINTAAMTGVGDFVAPTTKDVLTHGPWSHAVGDVESICPCAVTVQSMCCFDADSKIQKMFQDAGIQTQQIQASQKMYSTCYDPSAANAAREILSGPDLEGLYHCETQRVSDIHGVLPAQADVYFSGAMSEDLSIDGLSYFLSPRSGASLSNSDFVSDRNAKYVREQHRAVRVRNEHGDTIFNPLCTTDGTVESDIAKDGFPLVSYVDESPATAACVRYIFEYAWYRTLLQPKLVQSLRESYNQDIYDDMLAESWSAMNLWSTRCEVKLTKIDSCVNSAAYDVDFVRQNYVPHPDCPYVLESPEVMAIHQYNAALSPVACLVLKRTADGVFSIHDPHLCWSSECSLNSQQHYDDENKKFLSFDMIGECCQVFNPVDMLRTDEKQVQNVPSLDAEFMHKILNNHTFRARSNMFALKGDFMFPYASSRQTQCSPPIPYWPQEWQAPFGELLMTDYEMATGYPYMAAVTSDEDPGGQIREIAVIPDVLQQDRIAQSEYGGSGMCREPNFAMPVIDTNTLRLCEDIGAGQDSGDQQRVVSSNSSIGKQCSKSARVSVGAGQSHTLGFLLPLLLPFVHRESPGALFEFTDKFKDNDGKFKASEIISLFQAYGENLEILPMDFDDAENTQDTIHDTCTIHIDPNTDTDGVCFHNSDCQSFEVCSARGLCEEVDITVDNEHRLHEYELGMTGRGCQVKGGDDSIAGASPWQKVSGFMQHLGFCSHKNSVTYERLQRVYEMMTKMAICEHKERDNIQWFQCVRNKTKFDWINHAPSSLYQTGSDDFAEFTQEYEADMEEIEPENIGTLQSEKKYRFDFLRLQPHLCDMDYMHSSTLGFCKLRHVDPAGKVAKWMRMSELLSTFSFPLVQQNRSTETDSGLQCRVSAIDQKNQCKAGDKMRFMGLGYENIAYIHDRQTQSIVSDGKSCQLCEIEDFTMAGEKFVRIKPTWNYASDSSLKEYVETEICGSFGHVTDAATGYDCELDNITAVLPFVMMRDGSAGACRQIFKSHDEIDVEMMICSQDTGKCLFNSRNKIYVRAYLNGMFFFEPLYINQDLAKNIPENNHRRLALLQRCIDDVESFRFSQSTGIISHYQQTSIPMPKEQKNALQTLQSKVLTPGIYYFNLFNTYEVPLLYWQKYGLGVFGYTTNMKNRIDATSIIDWQSESSILERNQQFSWENRLGYIPNLANLFAETMFAASITASLDSAQAQPRWGDLWGSLNARQLVPTQQSLRSQTYNALSQFLKQEIHSSTSVASGHGTYSGSAFRVGIGHATKLSFARVQPHKGLEKFAKARQQHLNEFSDLVYKALTPSSSATLYQFQALKFDQHNSLSRLVGQKPLARISDVSRAEIQYFNQHANMVAAAHTDATKWVWYGTESPKDSTHLLSKYTPSFDLATGDYELQTTNFCDANNLSDCAEYVPISVHYKQIGNDGTMHYFVPYIQSHEDGVLSVQQATFSEDAFVHEFLMSILAEDGPDNSDLNFDFLDPFDTQRETLDSTLHAELSQQYILQKKLPLAVKKISLNDITAFKNKSEKINDKIREILQRFDRGESEYKQCSDDALASKMPLTYQTSTSIEPSCTWNPFSKSARSQESRRRQLQSHSNGKKASVVTVATQTRGTLTAKTFTIDICALNENKKTGYSAFHYYPNPVQDGPSCSFSDIANTYQDDTCGPNSPPSSNCDPNYQLFGKGKVPWSVGSIQKDDQTCRPDYAAAPSDINENIAPLNKEDAFFVGEMYLKNNRASKRSRNKICMRTDSSCIAQSATRKDDMPYSSLFYYPTDPSFDFDNPVDVGYNHLERTAWSQISPSEIRQFCDGRRGDLQLAMGTKIKNLYDSTGARLDITQMSYTEICKKLAEKHPHLHLNSVSDPKYAKLGYEDTFIKNTLHSPKVYQAAESDMLQGLKCNTKSVTAPEGVGVKLYRLNKKFTGIENLDTSFSSVTFSDRVLFRKNGVKETTSRRIEQLLFGHYFGPDYDSKYKKTQTHHVPTPAASFCSADMSDTDYQDKFDNLHKFRVVNYQTADATYKIRSPVWKWDWNLNLNQDLTSKHKAVENLARYHKECEDRCDGAGLCAYCGQREIKNSDGATFTENVGACCRRGETSDDGACDGQNGFVTRRVCTIDAREQESWKNEYNKWDTILRHKIHFENYYFMKDVPDVIDASASDPKTVCKLPAIDGDWNIWDLATCYEHDPYEHGLKRSWYLWSTSTACSTMMNFMDGSLSYLSMQLMAGLQARRSFWFAEILLGSVRTTRFKYLDTAHKVPCRQSNWKTERDLCRYVKHYKEDVGKSNRTPKISDKNLPGYDAVYGFEENCEAYQNQVNKPPEPSWSENSVLNYFKLQEGCSGCTGETGQCTANSVYGTIKHIDGGWSGWHNFAPGFMQKEFSYNDDIDDISADAYHEHQYIPAMSGIQDSNSFDVQYVLKDVRNANFFTEEDGNIFLSNCGSNCDAETFRKKAKTKWHNINENVAHTFMRPVIYPFFSFSGGDPLTDPLKSSGHFASKSENNDLINFMEVQDYLHQPRFGSYERNWRSPCQDHELCYPTYTYSRDPGFLNSNAHFNIFFKQLHAFYPFVNNWWGDLISSRNMLQSTTVCQCQSKVPNLKEIMYKAEGKIDDDLDTSTNKYSQPYDFEYIDPDYFTMPGAKFESECTEQCDHYDRSSVQFSRKPMDRLRVQSKIMHQNLAKLPADVESRFIVDDTTVLPLTLSPCIYDEKYHSDSGDLYSDMKIFQYPFGRKEFSWEDLIEDNKHNPEKDDYIEFLNDKYSKTWFRAARTFLDTMMSVDDRKKSTCAGGGSANRLVTKPSKWAQVDAHPGLYLMPCQPGEKSDDCHNILELIQDTTLTTTTNNDGTTTHEINTNDENDMICTFELELETSNQATNECYYDCDDADGNKPCSTYLKDESEKCHDLNNDGLLFSHLPTSEHCADADNECHGVSSCQECDFFDTKGVLGLTDGTQSTCIGSGLYVNNAVDGPTPARLESDGDKVLDYTNKVLQIVEDQIFGENDASREKLKAFMQVCVCWILAKEF